MPKLSIITPSFNQAAYLEETILSVLNQNYANLEYIVIDGGSTDSSVDIIKKYGQYIRYWVSEKDEGQSDAINKGFRRATGDYIAWMNADDIYYEGALNKIFSMPGIANYDFIYGPVCTGKVPGETSCVNSRQNGKLSVFHLLHFFYSTDYMIPSQSVFVKKEFLERHRVGYLNANCHYCMDMEWYCRIALHSPKYLKYNEPVSFFRTGNDTKTTSQHGRMQQEAIQIFLDYRKYLNKAQQAKLFNRLFLHRVLHRVYSSSSKAGLFKLLRVFFKAPLVSLNDRRFLGLLKRSLLNTPA